jgi:hypothetical protein
MISVKFFGYSSDAEYIDGLKMEVEDAFGISYPNAICEASIDTEAEEFEFSFTENWSGSDDVDEDALKEICNNHELYCSVFVGEEKNKSYFYDEENEFIYD